MRISINTSLYFVAILICYISTPVLTAPAEDLITSLPNLTRAAQSLNFKQYSGYLRTSKAGHELFYWLQQAETDPATAPIVLWLHGGPGCTGTSAALELIGAYIITTEGGSPDLNPNRWNKFANVLFFDSPPGAGYSTVIDGNKTTNDDETAMDNFIALSHFYTKFPELLGNCFYTAGESYGGISVTLLASLVLGEPSWNFCGLIISSGMVDFPIYRNSALYTARFRGFIGKNQWNKLVKNCCCQRTCRGNCDFYSCATVANYDCLYHYNAVFSYLGNYLYSKDVNDRSCVKIRRDGLYKMYLESDFYNTNVSGRRDVIEKICFDASLKFVGNSVADAYLDSENVRKALHASERATKPFIMCRNMLFVYMTYKNQYISVLHQLQQLLKKKKQMLICNGDADLLGSSLGGSWIADGLQSQQGLTNGTGEGQTVPFYYVEDSSSAQVGGFMNTHGLVTFANINGAGHILAEKRPAAFSALVSLFVSKNLPEQT